MDYVCDFCDSPVGLNDTSCRVCGANFSEVRCPKCGHHGVAKEFSKGCPKCNHSFIVFSNKIKKPFLNSNAVLLALIVVSFSLMILSLSGRI